MNQVAHLENETRGTRIVTNCEICGATEFLDVAAGSAVLCPIKMCQTCGHFFTSPCIDSDDLSQFYLEEFEGDAGAAQRLSVGEIAGQKIRREERKMRRWALPIITEYCDIKGKKVLDLRTRSGAMAELLVQEGAEVTGIDPFTANVDYATKVRKLDNITVVPLTEWHRLRQFDDDYFDVVNALTIHTLSHLPWPRSCLSRLYDITKPGALLFFDEKSILDPANSTARSVLDVGAGHFHHFTAASMRHIFEAAGFEVLASGIDSGRKSAARHLRLVARTPDPKPPPSRPTAAEFRCDTKTLLRQLENAEKTQRKRRIFNMVRGRFRMLRNRFR
jgi:SAM-dependent methyltransferase